MDLSWFKLCATRLGARMMWRVVSRRLVESRAYLGWKVLQFWIFCAREAGSSAVVSLSVVLSERERLSERPA